MADVFDQIHIGMQLLNNKSIDSLEIGGDCGADVFVHGVTGVQVCLRIDAPAMLGGEASGVKTINH
jgi:hypothetical protein